MKFFIRFTLALSILLALGYFVYFIWFNSSSTRFSYHHTMMFPGFGIGLVWFVVLIGFYLVYHNNPPNDSTHALTLLKERFARGDIDKETYKVMKKTLDDES